MICRCSDEGEAEADALVARVKAALSDPPIEDEEFVSALVMEFNWRWGAYVELLADQWFGVFVRPFSGEKVTLASETCDRIEDGLASCYEQLAGKEEAQPL